MTDTTIDTTFKLEGIDGAVATVRAFGDACAALPPGWSVETVMRLQDDEALVEKASLLIADLKEWPPEYGEFRQILFRIRARDVLALVDDVQGQRLFKVTMPNPTDGAATLRAMFGELDPGLGPQLRDFDDETGVFDVLAEHFRKPRT